MDPAATTAGPLWMSEFTPFGLMHFVVAGILTGLMVGASWLGRRWTILAPANERRLRVAWAWSIVAVQIFAIVWYAIPWDRSISIPLQLCDLAVWLAPVALLSKSRLARTLLYFWGIGLSTQAFVTPVLEVGPATVRFWLFWISHTQIVGSAIYVVAVLGYRPALRDLRNVALASLGYLALVFVLNIAIGTNYGYVGDTRPDRPTLIDRLGEWPLRVVYLTAIAMTVFVIAWAPWAWLAPERRSETESPEPERGD